MPTYCAHRAYSISEAADHVLFNALNDAGAKVICQAMFEALDLDDKFNTHPDRGITLARVHEHPNGSISLCGEVLDDYGYAETNSPTPAYVAVREALEELVEAVDGLYGSGLGPDARQKLLDRYTVRIRQTVKAVGMD